MAKKQPDADALQIGRLLKSMLQDGQAFTFESFFQVDSFTNTAILTMDGRQCLQKCEVIIAHDPQKGDELIFGYEKLQQVIKTKNTGDLSWMRIVVDGEKQQFNQLLAAVKSVKGTTDFVEFPERTTDLSESLTEEQQ